MIGILLPTLETSKLDDFNNLVTGLLRSGENRHNRRLVILSCWGPFDHWMKSLDILSP